MAKIRKSKRFDQFLASFDSAVEVLFGKHDWVSVEHAVLTMWEAWGDVFQSDAPRGFRDVQYTVYAAFTAVDLPEEDERDGWNRDMARAKLEKLLSRERSMELHRLLRPNLPNPPLLKSVIWIGES